MSTVRAGSWRLLVIMGVLIFALGVRAGIEEASLPPLVHVPPAVQVPTIDGIMSPGEWDNAFMGSGMVPLGAYGVDPIQMQYWLTYDGKQIYIAERMQTGPGVDFSSGPRKLAVGGPDAHFETLIDTNPCNPDSNWLQGMFYPLGKYENVGRSERIGGFVPYDVEWTYKDSWKDGWWTIEFTAPAEAFNRAVIADGKSWGILFAGRIAPPTNYFSNTVGDYYHVRARFLKVIFDKSAPVIRVTGLGDVSTGSITPTIAVRNTTPAETVTKR